MINCVRLYRITENKHHVTFNMTVGPNVNGVVNELMMRNSDAQRRFKN